VILGMAHWNGTSMAKRARVILPVRHEIRRQHLLEVLKTDAPISLLGTFVIYALQRGRESLAGTA
jgi:hypothetical protein